MPETEPLIIVGASTRAAAQSAVASGYAPWCVDQFGDADLRECSAGVQVVSDWPDGVAAALADAPRAPLVYAGALENSPELLNQLAERFPLAGCCGETLRRARDPFWIQAQLQQAGLPTLRLGRQLHTGDSFGRWLLKPLHSAAGMSVRHTRSESVVPAGYVLQEFVAGKPISGLYLGARSGVRLLGLSRQLCGEPDAGADGFLYCGSIGPLSTADVTGGCLHLAKRIGEVIGTQAGIVGLFGIDFIRPQGQDTLATLEVNPRWTASAELFERATGWTLMRWHMEACMGCNSDPARPALEHQAAATDTTCAQVVYGKLIVYAPATISINRLTKPTSVSRRSDFEILDVPVEGTVIHTGHPVCTLLTNSPSVAGCRRKLLAGARELRESLVNLLTVNVRDQNR